MNVYLLGAGASKSFVNSKFNVSMPIARDFFKTFMALDISSSKYVLIGQLLRYLKLNGKIQGHAQFIDYDEDIEIIHSEIYEKVSKMIADPSFDISNGDNYSIYKAHEQLLFLFNSVINEIQNDDMSEAHKKLIERIANDDTIITFNWDTLIDRALKANTQWNSENGYFIKPQAIYRDKWIENKAEPNSSEVPLLIKLHGSTNWLIGYEALIDGKLRPNQVLGYNTFYVYEMCNSPYPTFKGRYFPGYQEFSYGYYPANIPDNNPAPPEGYVNITLNTNSDPRIVDDDNPYDDGIASMPVIIPPVKNKDYDMFGDLFEKLWNKAHEQLKLANKIYIIGYSFPITDTRAHDLFARAFMDRSDMPYVYMINPNTEHLEYLFKHDFGINEEHLIIIKDYFGTNFNFNIFE